MTERDRPLEPMRVAHEEDYFARQNRLLIEKLRDKMAHEPAAEQLAAASGIKDQELLDALTHLGITAETLPLVELVPLLEVAWADGEVQPREEALLRRAAVEHGIAPGTPAHVEFEKMLKAPPAGPLYDAALNFMRAMLHAMPPEEAARARQDLTSVAMSVADATGGWFGVLNKVEPSERTALKHIANLLAESHGAAAEKVLKKL
jgi:hypothetical protein